MRISPSPGSRRSKGSKSTASSSAEDEVTTKPTGPALIDDPLLNKGTAFSEEERTDLGLYGLLPPHIETLEQQAARAWEAYAAKPTDLERHIYLRALQDTNETLFYRLIVDHLKDRHR